MKRSLSALLALSCMVVVSGCTAIPPIVARLDNGDLQVRVCDEIAITTLEIKTATAGSVDYRSAWKTTGPEILSFDYVYTYGTPPADWSVAFGPRELNSDDVISVTIGEDPARAGAVFYNATFSGVDLDEDWRDSEGNPAPSICDG